MERKTGIVRRIDDLGRVVIPKEIRRKLNIHEGDPLEITCTNDGRVFFRKYLTDEEKKEEWVNEILFRINTYDKDIFTFITKFIQNITILTLVDWKKEEICTSCAICSPQDKFDERVGIAIAYARMFDIEIPEYI